MSIDEQDTRQACFVRAFLILVAQETALMEEELPGRDLAAVLKRVEFIRRQCDHVARACQRVRGEELRQLPLFFDD